MRKGGLEKLDKGRKRQIDELTRITLDEFVSAFGVQPGSVLGRGMQRLLSPMVRRFALQISDYDDEVGELGLAQASRRLVERYTLGVDVTGIENIPTSGPLLLVSTHPGLTDTLALFSAIPRQDLRVIALERPFLRAMTHTSRHLIYIPDGSGGRIEAVRDVARALRGGAAVLTFPAGEIEPDPASMPGALKSLAGWSESTALFARMAPEACVMTVLVSGVIAPASLRHPLTRLRRTQKDRERLAATLQLLVNVISKERWGVRPRVRFGEPVAAEELIRSGDARAVSLAVAERIQQLIDEDNTRQSKPWISMNFQPDQTISRNLP